MPLDGSELAESVIPLAATMANKLDLEVVLFRAYHMPYNAYAGDADAYAMVNYDELLVSVRDEAKDYLDKQVTEGEEARYRQGVGAGSKEGSASDEIIALGKQDPGGSDRHVFPWPVWSRALGARQRGRKCRAP